MAKRTFAYLSYTPAATADTTAYTASTYQALLGGNATQFIVCYEIYLGGQAGASSPTIMVYSRDSTVGASTTALAAGSGATDAPIDPFTAALAAPPVAFITATTQPQRSSTLHLLALPYNAFGGVVKWTAAPGEEPKQYGNTQPLGETSLSAFTGGTTGAQGSHIMYEPS